MQSSILRVDWEWMADCPQVRAQEAFYLHFIAQWSFQYEVQGETTQSLNAEFAWEISFLC